ncbi:MAG: ribosome-associated translation inhibitor RaiA [Patescibacteria group bacterium]
MRIITKYTNLGATPAIDAYIENKLGSLKKFIKPWEVNAEIIVRVEIARTTNHHNKGDIFYAEANIDALGKLIRATHEDWDIRVAIDQMKDRLQTEIKKFNAKRRPQDSKGVAVNRKIREK